MEINLLMSEVNQVKVYSIQVNMGEGIGLEDIVGSIDKGKEYVDKTINHDYSDDDIVILHNPDNYDKYEVVYELSGEFLFGIKEHIVEME